MLKDFTGSRMLGKVVIERLPLVCAGLIAAYLAIAQPWKAPPAAPAAPPPGADVADASGAKPTERIAEAHTAPLERPTPRPVPAVAEPEPPPLPPPAPRNSAKQRQFQVQAKASSTPTAGTQPQPLPAAVPVTGSERPGVPEPGKDETQTWSEKVASLGGSAIEASKRGSARAIEIPVTAYQYSRDAVVKAAAAVGSMLPFTR